VRLEAGIPVPQFEAEDIDGKAVSPADYAGRRWWLILSRFAACPFCSLRLQRLIDRYGPIETAPVDVIVIFPSAKKRVRQYVKKYAPLFRVVSDEEQTIFKQFGSETSWAGELKSAVNIPKVLQALVKMKMNPLAIDDAVNRMPCEYLIEPDGMIGQVHYGESLDDGFKIETVLEWAGVSQE
jgi:peroxiredoxin